VGPIPVADYSVLKTCDEDNTEFTSSTGLDPAELVTYAWDFGDASSGSGNTSAIAKPNHLYTGVASYSVGLTLTTDLNCTNSIVKTVSILPYVKNFPYIETFESPTHGWVADGTVTDNSGVTSKNSWNLLTSQAASHPIRAGGRSKLLGNSYQRCYRCLLL